MKRWLFAAGVVGIVAVGFAARMATWTEVIRPEGVALKLSDSHYYVRFARLQLEAWPEFVRFDPYVNHPTGAEIIWPPGHAYLLAALVAGADEERAQYAAAWTGPVVSAVFLLLLVLLARRWFGRWIALGTAAVLALMPVCVEAGAFGNADHHVHEPFFVAFSALLIARALQSERRGDAIAAGVVLGAGRLLTTVAFVAFPLVAIVIAWWALRNRERSAAATRVALWAGAASSVTLSAWVSLFGSWRSVEYEGLTAFHPLWAAGCLFGAAAVCAIEARSWRAFGASAVIAVAALVPAAVGALRAVAHLRREDPLLAIVTESLPLYDDPAWAARLFGFPLLLLPLGAWGAIRGGAAPALRYGALGLGIPLFGAALLQSRFSQPFAGAAAVLLAAGMVASSERISAGSRRVLAGTVAVVAVVSAIAALVPPPAARSYDPTVLARPTIEWMRGGTPHASDAPYSSETRPSYGVVARFDYGHLVALWAERPVVGSPFSQAPWHVAGNARASAVLAAKDEESAYRAAKATGARYLLLTPVRGVLGQEVEVGDTFAGKLMESAALGTERFRVVRNSAEQRLRADGGAFARVVEVVEGAVIRGRSEGGQTVRLELPLRDHTGAEWQYVREGTADAEGRFEIRVAYPSELGLGRTDVVRATGPYVLKRGSRSDLVEVTEAQVVAGSAIEVSNTSSATSTP